MVSRSRVQHDLQPLGAFPPLRYPDPYVWMLFFSTMDIILTGLILTVGGEEGVDPALEINPLARAVIETWGMTGASVFKFCLVAIVIILCEWVGRNRDRVGRNLAWTCVVISAFPVAWSLALLFAHRFTFFDPLIDVPAMLISVGPVV